MTSDNSSAPEPGEAGAPKPDSDQEDVEGHGRFGQFLDDDFATDRHDPSGRPNTRDR